MMALPANTTPGDRSSEGRADRMLRAPGRPISIGELPSIVAAVIDECFASPDYESEQACIYTACSD